MISRSLKRKVYMARDKESKLDERSYPRGSDEQVLKGEC